MLEGKPDFAEELAGPKYVIHINKQGTKTAKVYFTRNKVADYCLLWRFLMQLISLSCAVSVPEDEIGGEGRTVFMTNKDGRKYACTIPQEGPLTNDSGAIAGKKVKLILVVIKRCKSQNILSKIPFQFCAGGLA